MDSGFDETHVALLRTWSGVARNKADPEQNAAYDELRLAYEATAAWAYALRDRLFPDGTVKKLSKPTDQAQKFKPYTWVRIYPRQGAPKALAYTVGLDAKGDFLVKLDTVDQRGSVRAHYMDVHGGDHRDSPIARALPMEDGLRLSLEGLVDWSIEAISQFALSYEALAGHLGLLSPNLKLVADPAISQAAFARWAESLHQTARIRGSVQLLLEERIVFRATSAQPTKVKLGLDPTGNEWGVEINAPNAPGDHNGLAAIAEDETGGLHLLRQGWLRGRRDAPDIREDEFVRRTGLQPVAVEASGRASLRRWFRVARLDDPAAIIRRDTARFVDLCWSARLYEAGLSTFRPAPANEAGSPTPVHGAPEAGGSFTLGPRDAQEAREVLRLQGEVWTQLAALLSANGVPHAKWQSGNYAIDMEIAPSGVRPILLEIKSGAGASELHTGVGQLFVYRQLFRNLRDHQPMLLLQGDVAPAMRAAIGDLGIAVHAYERGENGDIQFDGGFLRACRLAGV